MPSFLPLCKVLFLSTGVVQAILIYLIVRMTKPINEYDYDPNDDDDVS